MNRKVIGVVSMLVGAAACGSSGGGASISPSVVSWAPEDGHHVAVIVKFTNDGTKAGTALCTFAAYDSGGSVVGQDTDGPADKIQPSQSVNVRLLIKTDVATAAVADVREMNGVSCTGM